MSPTFDRDEMAAAAGITLPNTQAPPPPDTNKMPVRSLVAGDVMCCSVAAFRQRAEALLEAEQRKPNPDNALVAFICDAVRLSREYMHHATRGLRAK